MRMFTWVSPETFTELNLGDLEEFAAQRICEILQQYSHDFKGVFHVKVNRKEDQGLAGWAGTKFLMTIDVCSSDQAVPLECEAWVVNDKGRLRISSVISIKTPDNRLLALAFDGDDRVRSIEFKGDSIYSHWEKVPQDGLPKLRKFFFLDEMSVN